MTASDVVPDVGRLRELRTRNWASACADVSVRFGFQSAAMKRRSSREPLTAAPDPRAPREETLS